MRKNYSAQSILSYSSKFQKLANERINNFSGSEDGVVVTDTDKFMRSNKCSPKNEVFRDFLRVCCGGLESVKSDISLLAMENDKNEQVTLRLIDKLIEFCAVKDNDLGLLRKLNKLSDFSSPHTNPFIKIHECLDKYDHNSDAVMSVKDKVREITLTISNIKDELQRLQSNVKSKME